MQIHPCPITVALNEPTGLQLRPSPRPVLTNFRLWRNVVMHQHSPFREGVTRNACHVAYGVPIHLFHSFPNCFNPSSVFYMRHAGPLPGIDYTINCCCRGATLAKFLLFLRRTITLRRISTVIASDTKPRFCSGAIPAIRFQDRRPNAGLHNFTGSNELSLSPD